MFKFFSILSKKKGKPAENSLLVPQRFADGILIVTQDNNRNSLHIEAANMNAINILGYSNDELLDHDFRDFVVETISNDITSDIEFSNEGKNFSDVLTKIRRFKMKTKGGDTVPIKLRVVRSLTSNENPRFQLVMNDDRVQEIFYNEREKYRAVTNLEEIFDPLTNLPNRKSVLMELEILSWMSKDKPVMGTFVLIELADYDKIKNNFGDEVLNEIMRQFAQKVQFSGREEDIAGIYDERRLALMLLETPYDNINVPLKRLKWALESAVYEFDFRGVKNTMPLKANISYRKILPNIDAPKFIEDIKSGNSVVFE